MAGKSFLHLVGQIAKTSGFGGSVGSREVTGNSISFQRKHLQDLDPREGPGWTPLSLVALVVEGEGTQGMTVMEI